MSITINRNDLLHEWKQIAPITSTKAVIPALGFVRLEWTKDALNLLATDMDTWMWTSCPAVADSPGIVCLPASQMLTILQALEHGSFTITPDTRQSKAIIASGRSRFTLNTMDVDNYPTAPQWDETNTSSTQIDSNVLSAALRATSYAMAKGASRYTLDAVKIERHPNSLQFVAADGYRLGLGRTHECLPTAVTWECLMPRTCVLRLKTLYGDAPIQIDHSNNWVRFTNGTRTLATRTLNGNFPEYAKAIPTNQQFSMDALTTEFTTALSRANLMTDTINKRVSLHISLDNVLITAGTDQGEASASFLAQSNTEGILHLNSQYLLEALDAMADTERVTLTHDTTPSGHMSAVALIPADSVLAVHIAVIMPMRGNS